MEEIKEISAITALEMDYNLGCWNVYAVCTSLFRGQQLVLADCAALRGSGGRRGPAVVGLRFPRLGCRDLRNYSLELENYNECQNCVYLCRIVTLVSYLSKLFLALFTDHRDACSTTPRWTPSELRRSCWLLGRSLRFSFTFSWPGLASALSSSQLRVRKRANHY